MSEVLLVVAHGSRDPRHAATVHALVRQARSLRPGLRVETAFLDFNLPSVAGVLDRLASEGVRDVVALPLLLTRAFHAKSDIPAVLREAPPALRIRQAQVLGPSPLLIAAVERRLYEAGLTPAIAATATVPSRGATPGPPAGTTAWRRAVDEMKRSTGVVLASAGSTDPEAIAATATASSRGATPGPPAGTTAWRRAVDEMKRSTGVVLASAGSTDPEAIAAIAETARELRRTGWCSVRPAFASASLPRTEDAVRAMRADGVRRVAVAPYVIAPGRLPDRIAAGAADADVLADVLGPSPELARLLIRRYDECRTTDTERVAVA
ncbi:sirohydrochlorin chelatase [Streptomyces sp. P9(2023)]|uniref:sirohydrochlorin chelatase n=1 Tax=Streptomyces sp. P9(2023) TaxID=3064394 RepID=UPI0028F41366|nr:sirohydrochlorin chelatase [Streptomyces sp. P9(2023)]MDT9690193.1 sirohydrochlorin chelatase [Streptomyces sp. P9(2023)]